MKRLCLFISFILVCVLTKAQRGYRVESTQQQGQNIEALKVAFISKQLNLTPMEAERFWPVYNEYAQELKFVYKNNPNIIARDEQVLNIRKRYNIQFTRIIGPDRANTLFIAEANFRQLLIRTMRRQEEGRMHSNRSNHLSFQ